MEPAVKSATRDIRNVPGWDRSGEDEYNMDMTKISFYRPCKIANGSPPNQRDLVGTRFNM